jgi:hypothetical protein
MGIRTPVGPLSSSSSATRFATPSIRGCVRAEGCTEVTEGTPLGLYRLYEHDP